MKHADSILRYASNQAVFRSCQKGDKAFMVEAVLTPEGEYLYTGPLWAGPRERWDATKQHAVVEAFKPVGLPRIRIIITPKQRN